MTDQDYLIDRNVPPIDGRFKQSHSHYQYLCASTIPYMESARQFWENTFTSIPDHCRNKQVVTKFKSMNSIDHIAAAFELFNAATMMALFDNIVSDHDLNNDRTSNDSPDSVVVCDGRPSFVMEATCAFSGASSVNSDSIKNSIIECINENIISEHISIHASFASGRMTNAPSKTKILRSFSPIIEEWDSLAVAGKPIDHLKFTALIDDIKFEISPMPSKIHGSELIVMWRNGDAQLVNVEVGMKRKLKAKADKDYKNWGIPLFIALNVVSDFSFDDENVLNVLFGKESVRLYHTNGKVKDHEFIRQNYGFWGSKQAPRNTRIGGVLVFKNVGSWDFPHMEPTLYCSPDSAIPSPLKDCPYFRRVFFTNDAEQYTIMEATKSLNKLLCY